MDAMTSVARKSVLLAAALMLMSGCETLNPVTVGIGIVSYATTGKGLADHAIGKLTQKDCNILGGILSAERKICEPLGSAAAQRGFKGFFARSPAISISAMGSWAAVWFITRTMTSTMTFFRLDRPTG